MGDKTLQAARTRIALTTPDIALCNDLEPEAVATQMELVAADYQLAQRCVAGEVAAWEELYNQSHGSLVRTVMAVLRNRNGAADLADEIAAQVWFALVANDGKLLTRYDTKYGARLITFLRTIAWDLMCRHFRSERRREAREHKASRERPQYHASDLDQLDTSLEEFLMTLSPSERMFCAEFLLDQPASSDLTEGGMSRANLWQKTHRVYVRFRRFFSHGN